MTSHRPFEAPADHRIGGYRAWSLGAAAGGAADLLWISLAGARPAPHRVLPIGEPSLAVRRQRDQTGAAGAIELVVCTVYDAPFWYAPTAGEELIALRLKPERSARIFGVDPRDYRNAAPITAPRSIVDRMSATRRAAEDGDVADIACALIADAAKIAEGNCPGALLAGRAADEIRRRRGCVRIAALARAFAVSERHLRRTFLDAIGCTPKTYARRARLTAAAIAADAEDSPDWAQIALQCGFHDQPHMIAEYRALLGQTPRENHTERRLGSGFSNTAGGA